MNQKTDNLFKRVSAYADAALIFSEVNRFYFTGFAASDGALLIRRDGALFFTDSRYTEAAEKKPPRSSAKRSGRTEASRSACTMCAGSKSAAYSSRNPSAQNA